MLQDVLKKINDSIKATTVLLKGIEGEKEKKLYEAFMCACKSDLGNLQGAVDDANKKIPELESLIAELEALLKKPKDDVGKHKKDRAVARAAIDEASEIRKKEAAAAKAERRQHYHHRGAQEGDRRAREGRGRSIPADSSGRRAEAPAAVG